MGRPKDGGKAAAKNKKAWEQIQQQRALQKKQKVRRIVAIVVVSLVAVSLLGVGIWALGGEEKSSTGTGKGLMTAASLSADSVKDTEKLQGFVVGPEGVGSFKEGVPNIELYMSYGCPVCLQVENTLGADLQKMAKAGRANLIIHPVDTHPLAWTYVAGEAVYEVAKKDPEKLLEFHDALTKFAFEVMFKDEKSMQAQGNGTILADPVQSLAKVKEIAAKVGVKSEVAAGFKAVQEDSIVHKWAENWVNSAKKQTTEIGTPMFVKDGKIISLNDWDQKTPISDFLLKQ